MVDQGEPTPKTESTTADEGRSLEQRITDVAQSWPKLGMRYIGLPPLGPYDLPLEVTINFSGAYTGCLTLRTMFEMAQMLNPEKAKTNPSSDEAEVFQEFSVMFMNRLMFDLLGKDQSSLQKERPRFTNYICWPKEAPTASAAYLVDSWPFEVRFWVKATHD